MRLIDADRLLTDRMKSKYYHLPNGDIAIPLIDIEHAPTIEPETEEEAYERGYTAGQMAQRKKGKWVGAIEYCKHLEETTGERYQPSSLAGMIYCNQCWKASDRRSNYCRECGSYNWEGGDPI